MNRLNNDLDDFGTELPDSYTYSPRSNSMQQGRDSRQNTEPRQSLNSRDHQRPRVRQEVPVTEDTDRIPPRRDNQQYDRQPKRSTQDNPRENKRSSGTGVHSSATTDRRIRMFIGLLLVIIALLMAVFMLSHFKNGAADQSIVMNGGRTTEISNIGGSVGAHTSYFFVTRWFGLGALAFLAYFALVGLSMLGVWKTKFWSTTFQCLLIGITASIVLGLVTYTWPTALSWGGEHGRFVNIFLLENTGWPGAVAFSLLLLGSIVIVYFNQIYAFYKARKAELDVRRQRRQAAREEYERQRRAAEAALAKAKSELSEKEIQPETVDRYVEDAANASEIVAEESVTQVEESEKPEETEVQEELLPKASVAQKNEPATVTLDELEVEENIPDAEAPVDHHSEEKSASVPPGSVSQIDKNPKINSNSNQNSGNNNLPPSYAISIDEDEDTFNEMIAASSTSDVKTSEMENPEQEKDTEFAITAEPESPSGIIMIDEEDNIPEHLVQEEIEREEIVEDDIKVDDSVSEKLPSPADTPITVKVNEIEQVEHQSDLYDPTAELSKYKRPPLELLADDKATLGVNIDIEEQEENKQRIIKTLLEYGIPIVKIDATVGPTVTLFEIVPAEGVRIASIRRIEDDIARSLAAEGIRIIAPIPGKGTVGIEVPNHTKRTVTMRSVLSSRQFQESTYHLPVAMGTTVSNDVFIEDLAKMPHLLVAGATGQGKSVGLNAIISSLIYKKHPAELKFVLVDPKMVEFSLYNKLERHFLAKLEGEEDAIITDPEKVKATLNSLCIEMDNRYRLLKDAYVRSLEEYNNKFINRKLNPENGHKFLPYIVVVVDEFADLIMMAGKEIEMPIARIAQKARAVGIHLIIATQRPSTNVITGMIKANFPARIAFKVSAMVDSKTILDRTGANSLIGKGDMLFSLNSKLERVQCAFISTEEVEAVCDWIDSQVGYEGAYALPEYTPDGGEGAAGNNFGDRDSLFDEAARFVVASNTASTSALQRRYSIGYNRAGKIMDQMEAAGIVGPANGGKPRPVLVDSLTLERILENN